MDTFPMIVHTLPPVYIALLTGLYDFFAAIEESNGQLFERQIGQIKNYGVNPGVARGGLQWLVDKDYLVKGTHITQEESLSYWEFSPIGVEVVADLASKRDRFLAVLASSPDRIPATSFMDLRDFSTSVSEVGESLSEIASYVETNNEFELPVDERASVVTELRGLQSTIERGSIRTITLANALQQNGIFQFLKEKVPDKTIGALIGVVMGHIAKWLGW